MTRKERERQKIKKGKIKNRGSKRESKSKLIERLRENIRKPVRKETNRAHEQCLCLELGLPQQKQTWADTPMRPC